MLVLARRDYESVTIGGNVKVTVWDRLASEQRADP
jgi:sRNA-binding carbon storage regulator CsrA